MSFLPDSSFFVLSFIHFDFTFVLPSFLSTLHLSLYFGDEDDSIYSEGKVKERERERMTGKRS
jgi:hypothetical protein